MLGRGFLGVTFLGAIAVEGLLYAGLVHRELDPWTTPSLHLFAAQEPIAFVIVVSASLAVLVYLALSRAPDPRRAAWRPAAARRTIGALGVAAGSIAIVGHYLVYRDHPLAMDEFMTRFGEATLLRGDVLARIPAPWQPFAKALQPALTFIAPVDGLWGNPYRPINAAWHATSAIVFGTDALLNAILTGAAAVLVAVVAKQLWPTRDDAAVLAALLVAGSPQVLVTGMTLYAMPGHLLLNLGWLSLFLRGGRLGHGLAVGVGFFAVGLHQVNFHPLFVAPFIVLLALQRRWRLMVFYSVAYAGIVVFWMSWFRIALWWYGATGTGTVRDGVQLVGRQLFDLIVWPGTAAYIKMTNNVLRYLAWNHLALVPLTVASGVGRDRDPVVRACGWGIVVTIVFYLFVLPEQGHGWGYRYLHGFLGGAALIAAHGWVRLTGGSARDIHIGRVVVGGLTVATLCLIVVRVIQVEAFVEPRARALAVLRALPGQVVVVDDGEIWYGQDLAQNDPYLRNTPKIMALSKLGPNDIASLCPLRPRLIGYRDLVHADIRVSRLLWQPTTRYDDARRAVRECSSTAGPPLAQAETDRPPSAELER